MGGMSMSEGGRMPEKGNPGGGSNGHGVEEKLTNNKAKEP